MKSLFSPGGRISQTSLGHIEMNPSIIVPFNITSPQFSTVTSESIDPFVVQDSGFHFLTLGRNCRPNLHFPQPNCDIQPCPRPKIARSYPMRAQCRPFVQASRSLTTEYLPPNSRNANISQATCLLSSTWERQSKRLLLIPKDLAERTTANSLTAKILHTKSLE